MNNNQLININQNSKQALIKSKKLLDLTNKIITYNHKWIYQYNTPRNLNKFF